MAGVTPEGFQGRSFDEVFTGVQEKLRARLGAGLTLIPQSVLGTIAAIVAEEVADVWAMGEAVYLAFDEAAAAGAALENVSAITGTERLPATPSTVALTATGDTGTVLPAGRVAAVESTGVRFTTLADVTLAAAPPWTVSTVYAVGARVTTSNPSPRVYQCRVSGASAGSGTGPSGSGSTIADGTASWAYLGEGRAHADVDAECTEVGPVAAAAGTVTQKATPVSGWLSVTNVLDAVLGRLEETDESLRDRRRRELRGLGKASVAAIQQHLSDEDLVPGVLAVTVFENASDVTNADGMPPFSIEALVEGGDDQRIREVLWETKAAPVYTHGTEVGTVVDSEGATHTVRFSRPGILTIHVAATVQLTPDAPAEDAQVLAQLAEAVVEYGDALPSGRDVVLAKVTGALTSIPWVHDVSGVQVGLAADALGTANIPVTTRQRADFDSSRCAFTLQRLTAEQL